VEPFIQSIEQGSLASNTETKQSDNLEKDGEDIIGSDFLSNISNSLMGKLTN
jgi:hypothetical protein